MTSSRGTKPDVPGWIVAGAVRRLPAQRHAWGRALVAELAAIQDARQRWRFAAGVLRVVLFPPAARPGAVRATAAVGIVVTVLATLASVWLVPTIGVFVAALGLLVSGHAVAVACRSPRLPSGRAALFASAVAVAGLVAVTGIVIVAAATHPAATRDQTHVYSVVLAVTLCGYLIAGRWVTVKSGGVRAVLWGGVAGATATIAVWTALPPAAVKPPISQTLVGATLCTAIAVGASTRSRRSGAQAGLLVAILAAPIDFVAAVTPVQFSHSFTLTDPYDIHNFPYSGYPDVASYLLSDELAGNVIRLVVTPLVMYAIAWIGAAIVTQRRLEPGRMSPGQ
ncbi:MAG: hypothetical protein J2P15_12335 [Micromonosporaceae bacterium]|nr:hypothetical protein [Micromonosporaceae bacterium]